jgi:alpha 1,3-glucosidase
MRGAEILLCIFALLQFTFAVKKELFKRCDQSGFCHRNRHYAQEIEKTRKNYYSVESKSLNFGDSVIIGNILKSVNETHTVKLPFELDILQNDNIRVRIDEDRSQVQWDNKLIQKERYSDAHKWAFVEEPRLSSNYELSQSSDKFTVKYGEGNYEVDISTDNFQIVVKYKGETQLILNERNLLNVEHFRVEEDNAFHLLPEETDFDSFHDSFKDSKSDSLPFGPESVALDVTFQGFKYVYGIPEHADSLVLKDTTQSEPYRLYNVDIFEYETDSRLPMYGSIPYLVAHKPGLSAGIFWVNGADTYVDIERQEQTSEQVMSTTESTKSHWMSENGIIDLLILIAETPEQLTKNYASLTGTTSLPQLFSLGYHQCRWNYNDEEDVLGITENMDKYQIPYDTIWLDIEYTDSKKYFTWKKESFPDPDGMMKKLAKTGRNIVTIIDPHIKIDYEVSNQIESKDMSVLSKDGDAFHGHCWPGESIWIDTFKPGAVEYWKTLFANNTKFSGDATNLHIWNDMNEPSVFSGPETTSPKDLITHESVEIRSDHNIYGLSYHEATYEAMKTRYVNKRPFVLTRAFFAGSQRSAAMWTGDNMSQWSYLKISLPMILTQNLVGMPFSGADVGGFFGDPSKELLTRWYQAGIWYPFFRAHAHIDSRRREPWIVGEPYTSLITDAVKMRYALLPLWYTKFYESSKDGSPVITPMFFRFPDNEDVFGIEDSFFLGDLLIKPVTDEGSTAQSVYLPDDSTYYDYETYEPLEGRGEHQVEAQLSKIPVYIKSGSITPRKDRYRRSSKLMRFDPYTLVIALDSNGEAHGNLYIDDGETFDYQHGEFVYLTLNVRDGVISSRVLDGSMNVVNKLEKIIILGADVKTATVTQDGESWDAQVKANDTYTIIKNPKVIMGKPWSIKI